jgi:uncharacterized OB-fold protein
LPNRRRLNLFGRSGATETRHAALPRLPRLGLDARPSCFECGSERLAWTPMSGKGEVYSFTVIRQVVGRAASKAFEPDIPYVIAWVDLEEGPRMITNVVGCGVEDVKLGMKVSVVFEQQSPEIWLPKFKPSAR